MAMPELLGYTVDEVLAFPPDGNRYELVDGELLVTPSPAQKHEIVRARLAQQLLSYVAPHNDIAWAFVAPADIIWSKSDYVQPDLLVVPANEVTGNWRDCQHLLLAIEVISPSSARGDRFKKRRLYQRRGVATYWVVDPDAELIEVWHPEDVRPEIVVDAVQWNLTAEGPDLTIDVSKLFTNIPG